MAGRRPRIWARRYGLQSRIELPIRTTSQSVWEWDAGRLQPGFRFPAGSRRAIVWKSAAGVQSRVAISHGAAGTVVWQSRAGLCWWIAKIWQRVRFRLWRSVRGRVRAARSAGIQPHAFGNRPATALWKQPARLCRQTTAAIRESRIRIQLESAAHAELWRQAGNGLRCSVSELSCLRIRGIGLQWWRFWKRFLQVFCGLIWGFAALRRLPPLRRRS